MTGAPARALSLERKLPLFMTGVLALGLAAALALTYVTLARSARVTAEARLERAVRQLGTLLEAGTGRLKALAHRVAGDTAVVRALELAQAPAAAPGDTAALMRAARAALARMRLQTDTTLPVELWTADGRRVTHVGRDIRAAATPGRDASPGAPPAPGDDLFGAAPGDSARIGPLYSAPGGVFFWTVVPVTSGGRRLGYVAGQRIVRGDPQTRRTLGELFGSDVDLFYRDVERPVRVAAGGQLVPARAPDSDVLHAEERVDGTPFVLELEAPLGAALAQPRRTLLALSLISLGILLSGAALSWRLSRRITRPIVALGDAAASLAGGNYAARVAEDRGDEIGRLAVSFNRMAEKVGASLAAVEEREEQFRALADAIPQLAFMTSGDGNTFWYNRRWYEFTGLTPEESVGSGWQPVLHPEYLPRVLARWNAAFERGEPFEMDFPLRGADGRFCWFLTRIQPVHDREGKVARWFGTSTDVQALSDAREAAQSANKAKSDFLTTMSHELRTPLNAIGGYAELLEMELRGPITDAQRRDLERIKASQQHLLGLISGMLDLSRIESGTVTYQLAPVAVDPFLAGLDALVAPQAAAKSLALEYAPSTPDLAVLADREKLRQVLLNLLSNSIRYTPAGGRVTLSAEARGASTIALMVHDTGIGIPPEKLEHIFEPFVQLDRTLSAPREGVGLGLAISRDLARGMGGELTAESEPGKGSCFTVTLPRAEADTPESMAQSGEMPVARSLIADR